MLDRITSTFYDDRSSHRGVTNARLNSRDAFIVQTRFYTLRDRDLSFSFYSGAVQLLTLRQDRED